MYQWIMVYHTTLVIGCQTVRYDTEECQRTRHERLKEALIDSMNLEKTRDSD